MFGFFNVGKDFLLNIVASMLLVGVSQLVIYPIIAEKCSADSYGLFLTLMGITTMVSGVLGNSLNNVRLIMHSDYFNNNIKGDFNILLCCSLISIIFIYCGTLFLIPYKIDYPILYLFLIILMTVRSYYCVDFRININYVRVLIMNLILSSVYVIMSIWYYYFGLDYNCWIFIFLLAEIIANFYIFIKTDLWREPLIKTRFFRLATGKYFNLIYLSIISGLLTYFDRNLLYPLMGGKIVAVYFAASLVGKTITIFVAPASNVLLSYFSQVEFKMNVSKFWKINLLIVILGIMGYLISLLISNFIVQFFYPKFYNDAKNFFYIANLVPILNMIADMARPTVLEFVELSKLSIIQTIFFILAFFVSYYAITANGLYGFCCGAIGLSAFKIISMWFLGHSALCKK